MGPNSCRKQGSPVHVSTVKSLVVRRSGTLEKWKGKGKQDRCPCACDVLQRSFPIVRLRWALGQQLLSRPPPPPPSLPHTPTHHRPLRGAVSCTQPTPRVQQLCKHTAHVPVVRRRGPFTTLAHFHFSLGRTLKLLICRVPWCTQKNTPHTLAKQDKPKTQIKVAVWAENQRVP